MIRLIETTKRTTPYQSPSTQDPNTAKPIALQPTRLFELCCLILFENKVLQVVASIKRIFCQFDGMYLVESMAFLEAGQVCVAINSAKFDVKVLILHHRFAWQTLAKTTVTIASN